MSTPVGFWDKVVVGKEDECWPWVAYRLAGGYGAVRVGSKIKKAHRVAYEDSNGPIPEGKIVMHRCDNPPCCNPNHLVCGSHKDNVVDRDMKGRHVSLGGEQHGMSKLTFSDVQRIKRLGKKQSDERNKLAQKLGVTSTCVADVIRGKTWKSE